MSEDAALTCPNCGASKLRRSRRVNTSEMLRMMVGIYPFRCISCGDRFWGNVWLFSSWRWARCPRCLTLNLTDWPRRHYHLSAWAQILTRIGAKRHRCSHCRNNFLAFRSRLPAYEDTAADSDELDFGEDRSVKSSEEKNAK